MESRRFFLQKSFGRAGSLRRVLCSWIVATKSWRPNMRFVRGTPLDPGGWRSLLQSLWHTQQGALIAGVEWVASWVFASFCFFAVRGLHVSIAGAALVAHQPEEEPKTTQMPKEELVDQMRQEETQQGQQVGIDGWARSRKSS